MKAQQFHTLWTCMLYTSWRHLLSRHYRTGSWFSGQQPHWEWQG